MSHDNASFNKDELYNSKPSVTPEHVEVGFKDRDQRGTSKLYAFFLLVAGFIIIGLIIAVAILATRSKNDEGICMTDECVKAASNFLESMDTSVKPCDDFFQYACGMWNKKHVIPEDKASIGVFSRIRDDVDTILKNVMEKENGPSDVESVKKARRYYTSCLDLEKIENLTESIALPFIHSLGEWPVLGNKAGGHWNRSTFRIEDLLVTIREYTNSPPIMDMYVYDDSKDPLTRILYIDQPSLGMPERSYYLKSRNDKVLMAYQTYATDMAVLMGADQAQAKQQMKEMVDFEIKLANLSMPEAERRDEQKLYNLMTIQQLIGNFTEFKWLNYFKAVMGKPGIGINIDQNERIIVRNPDYIRDVFKLISKTPPKTVANYVVWRAMKWMTDSLPSKFRALGQTYRAAIVGTSSVPARWKSCASEASDQFAMAVGRLFVNEAFNVESKEAALELIEMLRTSMKELISETEWMDDATKKVAKDKADHIEPRIGFSDAILNDKVLHDKYNNLEAKSDEFFKNGVRAMKFYSIENLKKLRQKVDRSKWESSPAVVNAYYNPSRNQISFPGGILQPPFFSGKYPKYLNFGGIGYVIGHEITHGFDDQGRLYDKDGNLKPWWGQSSIDGFTKRANCTINQYSNYKVAEANKHLNGKLTLGENIADNGGLKESFRAYRAWVKKNGKEEQKLPGLDFSPDQLFFLNAAHVWCGVLRPKEAIRRILTDPHSNMKYRVIGSMQYNEDFARTFNCPKGSFMNPEKRCKIW